MPHVPQAAVPTVLGVDRSGLSHDMLGGRACRLNSEHGLGAGV